MLKDRAILFYPLVVAAFPVVFLYSQNTGKNVTFAEFIVPLTAILLLTALSSLLLRVLIRDSVKVSLIVSMCLVVFFSYGPVYDLTAPIKISIAGELLARHRYLLPSLLVMLLVGIWVVFRFRGNLTPLVRGGTLAALLLTLFNVARIVAAAGDDGPAQILAGGDLTSPASSIPGAGQELPDIYYLIFDGYSNSAVLQEIHGFDNSEFIGSLERKGFVISPEARSNYPFTIVSIASSLKMQYPSPSDRVLHQFANNPVLKFTRSLGYRYVHLDSGFAYTRRNPYADIEVLDDNGLGLFLSDYGILLIGSTVLPPVAWVLGISLYSPFVANEAKRFNENMDYLHSVPEMPEPTFTFNHNMPPNTPYIFDRDGNPPQRTGYQTDPTKEVWPSKEYTDQIVYINKRIEELVDHILDRSTTEPVIIIQGDHGSGSLRNFRDPDDQSDLALFERTGILNAYYLPEYCRSALYPEITPVNTFRLVFDACLGGDFGLLKDETHWWGVETPIDFSRFSR